MPQILIVEDEELIASFIARGLRKAGYATPVEAEGTGVADLAASGEFGLVILDVGLPDIDGFDVLRAIRSRGLDIPVIMLTARTAVRDRVLGLEEGADDYVPKPFDFDELLARVRSRLRTSSRERAAELRRGHIVLDLKSRRATAGEEEIDLSAREFALLEVFLRHPGHVLSRDQLLNAVWGYDADPHSKVVDVYVLYLRRKLGTDIIETIRGMGYRLA